MEYEEIISEYKNGSIDISDLKKKIEIARPLNSRPSTLDLDLISNTFVTIRDGTNAQTITEKPERIEEYKYLVNMNLLDYFTNIVDRINSARAWGIMKVVPTKITKDDFKELSIDEKLRLVITLNRKYKEYLKIQKYADLRECIIGDGDLQEENIQKMQFVINMFNALKSKVAKEDFFCLPDELILSLFGFKRSKYKRLEDYFNTKNKYVRQLYENNSNYYTTEDFRDIIDNIQSTAKTLKISVNKVIEYYSLISKENFEIRGLEDEYDVFIQLQDKNKKMKALLLSPKEREEITKSEQTVEENEEEIVEELPEEHEIKEVIKEKPQQVELSKETGLTGKTEEQIKKENERITVKEQINPLILAWFGKEDRPMSDIIGPRQLSKFLEKIKQIEKETGIRVGLYIVTNADKEVALNRMQELQHKAKAKGLPKLVEGTLGGYCSYRIEQDGTITDLAKMDNETRERLIDLLDKSPYIGCFRKDVLDPRETNYLRYFYSIKKNPSINFQYLKWTIAQLLKDVEIKKQPLSFVPFIEGDFSGVDVLLQSQLDGLDKLSDYLKSKYYIAPGKTMKANIYAVGKFSGDDDEKEKN